jgi:hypothetical protein
MLVWEWQVVDGKKVLTVRKEENPIDERQSSKGRKKPR